VAVETLFGAPHNATAEEAAQLLPRSWGTLAREREEIEPHDSRMISLWNLYRIRGDEAGMRATEARFEDRSIVEMELRYRDVFDVLPPAS
jgi:hypothetical protein